MFNTTDFPDHRVDPYAIEVVHPDAFLLDLTPGAVIDELTRQPAANRRGPSTLLWILDAPSALLASGCAALRLLRLLARGADHRRHSPMMAMTARRCARWAAAAK